ncbi:aspartyl-phosphate phosphatase Spo0E family protein [Bacillaceae bacterium W0354]
MSKNNREELENKIENIRSKLVEMGLDLGLNHSTTIKMSQELDELIAEFQSYYMN